MAPPWSTTKVESRGGSMQWPKFVVLVEASATHRTSADLPAQKEPLWIESPPRYTEKSLSEPVTWLDYISDVLVSGVVCYTLFCTVFHFNLRNILRFYAEYLNVFVINISTCVETFADDTVISAVHARARTPITKSATTSGCNRSLAKKKTTQPNQPIWLLLWKEITVYLFLSTLARCRR